MKPKPRPQEMKAKRKRYDASFKARVALEATKGLKTIPQIAKDYEVHPEQVSTWKKQMAEGLPELFGSGHKKAQASDFEKERDELHAKIGQLIIEVDFMRKKSKQLGL